MYFCARKASKLSSKTHSAALKADGSFVPSLINRANVLLRLLHHVPSALTLYRQALAECGARDRDDSDALLAEESSASSRGKDAHEVQKELFWDAANAKTLAQYNLASLLMLCSSAPQEPSNQLAAKQADALFREVLSALRERKKMIEEDNLKKEAMGKRCVGMTAQQRRIVADTCGDRLCTSALN